MSVDISICSAEEKITQYISTMHNFGVVTKSLIKTGNAGKPTKFSLIQPYELIKSIKAVGYMTASVSHRRV